MLILYELQFAYQLHFLAIFAVMKYVEERNWKLLSSKYIFNRPPWMTLRCESFEMPNGRVVPEYYILEYPDWVNVIAITTDGKFVFISQFRPGSGRTSYELSAGVCDKEDDSPLCSARRELLEETGYGGGDWQEYMVVSANPATHTNYTHCYLARNVELSQDQNLDNTEDILVHLLTLEQVKELLLSGEFIQALQAAPLWKYIAENKS